MARAFWPTRLPSAIRRSEFASAGGIKSGRCFSSQSLLAHCKNDNRSDLLSKPRLIEIYNPEVTRRGQFVLDSLRVIGIANRVFLGKPGTHHKKWA
jgi:hypothetical protein